MGLFKSLGRIVKKATKPVKKVLKSDLGKLALMYGAYQYGPLMFKGANPGGLRGLAGWQKAAPSWLYSAGQTAVDDPLTGLAKNAYNIPSGGIIGKAANTWKGMSGFQKQQQ